jgi:excisionase family DNA binding protein
MLHPIALPEAEAAAPPDEEIWTDQQVAGLLGVSVMTLAAWRSSGRYGLRYFKIGRLVRYRKSDLMEWLESRQRGG